MKQFYINSTGNFNITRPFMNQGLIPESFSFDVPLIAPIAASVALYWSDLMTSRFIWQAQLSKTLYERIHLTVTFNSLKIEFNAAIIRHMAVSIQLSIVNNIFKATVLITRQEIVEYCLEYRRKTYINF